MRSGTRDRDQGIAGESGPLPLGLHNRQGNCHQAEANGDDDWENGADLETFRFAEKEDAKGHHQYPEPQDKAQLNSNRCAVRASGHPG